MESAATYKRILAVKLADQGDLLTITPALEALKAAHPQAQIDLLAQPNSARILRGLPFIDNIIEFAEFTFDSPTEVLHPARILPTLRLLLKLRLARYDAFAIFHHPTTWMGAWERAILAFATGARDVAGLESKQKHAQIINRMLTRPVPDLGFGAMHEADYWLAVAGALGADAHGGWRVQLALTDADREVAAGLLEQQGISARADRPLVAMHTGSGGYSSARRWPQEHFAGVAQRLIKQHNAQVVILGGPDEVEMAANLTALIASTIPDGQKVHTMAGRTTMHETAAIIERCSLFIGNDSGPMHMAVAVGTPVVAIFGPSNKEAWGPYTPPGEISPHTIVSRNLPCQPCFYRGLSLGLREGCGPRPCLTGLGVERVVAACSSKLTG